MSKNTVSYPPFSGKVKEPVDLSSTATRWRMYRTVDETTNFEYFNAAWNGTNFDFSTAFGGTGSVRPMRHVVNGNVIFTVGANGVVENVVTVTADSTMGLQTKLLRVNSASPTNQTLPSPIAGVERIIKNRGAGLVTLIGTIDGSTGVTLAQNKAIRLIGNGTDFDLLSVIV